MYTDPSAPPVVAVVVSADPGPWLETALASLAAQDYPNLSILVVDSASGDDPTERVAAVEGSAYVCRLEHRVGFGRAANEVLNLVDGASHYLFCHDDVALAPDAVRLMVEEAYRSNAGIVSPKMVDWDDPQLLLAVGAGADRAGVVHPLVEHGELDQEQHDAVRDVFVAPGGAMLVRADLFSALGGYDPEVDQVGEDLDLSWRAHLAGARVLVAPAALVRHLEATRRGMRSGYEGAAGGTAVFALREQHRVATVLRCYRLPRLLLGLPLLIAYQVIEVMTHLFAGRFGMAWCSAVAPARPLLRPRRLWSSRRRVQACRRVSDGEVAKNQTAGNVRFRNWVRAVLDSRAAASREPVVVLADLEAEAMALPPSRTADPVGVASAAPGLRSASAVEPLAAPGDPLLADEPAGSGAPAGGREPAGSGEPGMGSAGALSLVTSEVLNRPRRRASSHFQPVTTADWRVPAAAAGVLGLILLLGSRGLLGGKLPAIGDMPVAGGGLGSWWSSWWSTWHAAGLGISAPGAPAAGLLAIAATVFFGAVGVLGHVLVLAPLVVGPLGAYRAARWWGSSWGRVAALAVYASVPVPYDAIALGQWQALVAYAAAPWVLSLAIRLSGDDPFAPTKLSRVGGRLVGLGLVVAVVAAFAPSFIFVIVVVGIALLAGSVVSGTGPAGVRLLGVCLAGALVAAVLLLPWSAATLSSSNATFGASLGHDGVLTLGHLLRFDAGPIGWDPLGWALLGAAALPLLIGRGWRLAWAGRMWMVAFACFGWAWAGSRGWVPVPSVEIVLAPAAAALAASAALGAAAFDSDLPGYRFGWRQLASGLAGVGLVVAVIPLALAAGNGRWDLPSAGPGSILALPSPTRGQFRVLWAGYPPSLPLSSRTLEPSVGYATSFNGLPRGSELWPAGPSAPQRLIGRDLQLAQSGLTTKLGHLLAPFAVLYLVVPNHDGPSGSGSQAVPIPSALLSGLRRQTDLVTVATDPHYTVYRNAAWAPAVSVLPSAAISASRESGNAAALALQQVDLSRAPAALHRGELPSERGNAAGGSRIYVSAEQTSAWRLEAAGHQVRPRRAFGWAMSFKVPAASGTSARLVFRSPVAARLEQVGQIFLWAAALGFMVVDSRRRSFETQHGEPSGSRRRPGGPGSGRRRLHPSAPILPEAGTTERDEVWIDA